MPDVVCLGQFTADVVVTLIIGPKTAYKSLIDRSLGVELGTHNPLVVGSNPTGPNSQATVKKWHNTAFRYFW